MESQAILQTLQKRVLILIEIRRMVHRVSPGHEFRHQLITHSRYRYRGSRGMVKVYEEYIGRGQGNAVTRVTQERPSLISSG